MNSVFFCGLLETLHVASIKKTLPTSGLRQRFMTYFIPLEINFLANIYLLSKLGNSRLRGEEYRNILTTALSCQGDCIGRRHIKHGGVLQELVYGGDRQVDGDGGGTSVHDRDDVFY